MSQKTQERRITMPTLLWNRVIAMIERDGVSVSLSEALRKICADACDKSEEKAERERNEQRQ